MNIANSLWIDRSRSPISSSSVAERYVDSFMRPMRIASLTVALLGCSSSPADLASAPDAGVDVGVAESSVVPTPDAAGATPVYFTFVSHNERTLTRFASVRDSVAGYRSYRDSLLRVAEVIRTYGFKLSWQTDYVVLDGIEKFETQVLAEDPSKTKSKRILVYLKDDLGVSIEPHAHECIVPPSQGQCSDKPYNYADVVSRIRSVGGVEPAAIIGGSTTAERSLAQWTSCITGNVFPEKWCPKALTVFAGATGGHPEGSDDFHSGVWRPSSLEEAGFLVDDPKGQLAYIGSGYLFSGKAAKGAAYQPVSFVKAVVAKLASGELPKGRVYTASAMLIEDKLITDAALYTELETMLKELQTLAKQGSVVGATYPEVLEVWSTTYGRAPNVAGF